MINFTLKDFYPNSKGCDDGTYLEVLDSSCRPCHGSCVTCLGPNAKDCQICAPHLFFSDLNMCDGNKTINKLIRQIND
jgi:hypothetical protein